MKPSEQIAELAKYCVIVPIKERSDLSDSRRGPRDFSADLASLETAMAYLDQMHDYLSGGKGSAS